MKDDIYEQTADGCVARGRDYAMETYRKNISAEEALDLPLHKEAAMRSIQNAVWGAEEMATIQNKDRMLPSQPYFQKMYHGSDFHGDLEKLVSSMYAAPKWDIKTKDGMTYAVMGSDLNTLHFYQFLIRSHGYKNVLELGTYIGVSAMYMADAGAHVTTVEKGEEFYNIARNNIVDNGFELKIALHNRDAIEFFKKSTILYDLILIDCAKESYKELLNLSLFRLADGGMILVDDIFFQGDTLNETPTSEKGLGVKRCIDLALILDDWEKVILPIGNGLMMLRKC